MHTVEFMYPLLPSPTVCVRVSKNPRSGKLNKDLPIVYRIMDVPAFAFKYHKNEGS